MKTSLGKNLIAVFAVIIIAFSGCKKDFLDVNDNPNAPADVDMQFLLPSAQADLAYTLGNHFNIVGGIWSQYWTQGPNASQYIEFDQYSYNSTEADYPWSSLYPGTLKDLDVLYEKAAADGNLNYMAVARIMQAYTLQVITDTWGDVPYSEALKLKEDGGITSPKYDSQESIYDALITLTDEGLALLDSIFISGNYIVTPTGDVLADMSAEDLVYQGDIDKWYRFGMTLKLKIYLRQVNIRPAVASAGIASMIADPTYYLEPEYDAIVHYIDEKFNQHPLYTTIEVGLSGVRNIFASNTSVKFLDSIGDPRLYDFYEILSSGSVGGINQGSGKNFPPNANDSKYSQYSEQIISASVPVRLMSASESMFLQAEAMARGYMPGDAQSMYEAAIANSWGQWEFSSSQLNTTTYFDTYIAYPEIAYPTGGSMEDQVKAIITQKWIAMNGNQNFEAWTEWRRTGYPDFFVESESTVIPGQFPARLLYPSDELTTNPNVITGLTVTNKMWWDTN